MRIQEVVDREWEELLTLLPEDLEELASQHGALLRRREVQSASGLLRLAMAYAVEGRSLRQTVAWARAAGVANLSDVALLKRLKGSVGWLGAVLGSMLAQRALALRRGYAGLRVRLLDATCVSRCGSQGTDWRVHLGYDLGTLAIDHVELTDAHGGETLTRHDLQAGELVVADTGYAHRRGLQAVANSGAYVLVRLNWQNLPLLDSRGQALDIPATLRQVPAGAVAEVAVCTAPDHKAEVPSIAGRLVAVRKSPQAAERARRRAIEQAKKKGRTPDARTLVAADFIFVFTTVPVQVMASAQVLEVYRLRWQIEIAFKRLKGILCLDEMAAQDELLCQTFLLTKIIAALLVEDLARRADAFSPWGYGRPRRVVTVAGVPLGV